MIRHYTIDEQHVVHGPYDFDGWIEWAKSVEDRDEFERLCRVGRTQVDGDCYVSTVFLRGIDHSPYFVDNLFGLGPHEPLLFETMVVGDKLDGGQWRYSTWEEAAAGHQFVVDVVMGRRQLVEPEDLEVDR